MRIRACTRAGAAFAGFEKEKARGNQGPHIAVAGAGSWTRRKSTASSRPSSGLVPRGSYSSSTVSFFQPPLFLCCCDFNIVIASVLKFVYVRDVNFNSFALIGCFPKINIFQ